METFINRLLISIINKDMVKSRVTKQKELLNTHLDRFSSFFTADELFANAKALNPMIGIATVYRFLKERVAEHSVHSYLCNRTLIYSKNDRCHAQFTCEKCGKTTHFELEDLSFFKKKIKGNVCHVHIDVSGVCDKCLSK
jgi:Fe2+ or Zn2+ uptake regulation protein